MTGMKNCAFSLLLYPLKKKKLSILPHKQNVHREQKEVVAENAAQRSSWGNKDVRWKMIPRVDLLPPQHCWCIISFSHLNTVRGQGACGRSPVRCVHPGGGAMGIWVLVPSRPQLRAATVRVRLHLPAGDQVGLQAWRGRNRERRTSPGRSVLTLRWNCHPCVDESIGGGGFRTLYPAGWIPSAASGMKLESREGEAVKISVSPSWKSQGHILYMSHSCFPKHILDINTVCDLKEERRSAKETNTTHEQPTLLPKSTGPTLISSFHMLIFNLFPLYWDNYSFI